LSERAQQLVQWRCGTRPSIAEAKYSIQYQLIGGVNVTSRRTHLKELDATPLTLLHKVFIKWSPGGYGVDQVGVITLQASKID